MMGTSGPWSRAVLKAAGFVFTENPLQALLPRTLGTTHLWDVGVARGGCTARGQWASGSGSMLCPFETPGAFCGSMHASRCSAATRRFTNSHVKCLHPEMGSGRECGGRGILTNTLLLKHRIEGVLSGHLLGAAHFFLHAFTNYTFI